MLFLLLSAIFPLASSNVAFTAVNGYMTGNNHYIGFRTILTNLRSNFDPNYGVFRGERPGLYYFSLTTLSDERTGCRISLRKNAVSLVTSFSSINGFHTNTLSVVVHVVPDDLIYAYVEDGSIYVSNSANGAFTSFSGFFLYSVETAETTIPPSGGLFSGLFGRSGNNTALFETLEHPDPMDNIFQMLNVTKPSTF